MFNLEKYTILVVDDFAQMRSTCRRMLQDFDPMKVDICGTGDEAIEMMRHNHYDIVLCDYNLGSGKDGQQVLEESRHEGILEYASIFIMITGENTKAMVMAAVEYEPDEYLTKPFTKEVLIKRLERIAARKQGLEHVGTALRENDYEQATDTCDQLIKQHPKNAISLLKIKGKLLYQADKLDLAEQVYESVLAQHSLAWAHMGMGKVHFKRQDFNAAKAIFSQIIEESPNQMEAYDWLAQTLAALDENQEAQDILQRASELSPQVLIRRQRLADIALKNGDIAAAELATKAAVKLSEGSSFKRPEDFTNLAKILVEQKRDQKAMQCLKQGRDNFNGQTDAMLQLNLSESNVHLTVNREAQAKQSLKNAMHIYKKQSHKEAIPTDTALSVAEACMALGDTEMGTEVMVDVIENNHENQAVIERARVAFNNAGIVDMGEALIQKSITRIANINNDAAKLANEGHLDKAIALFVDAANKLPGNKVVNLNAAQALLLNMKRNGFDSPQQLQCQNYLDQAKAIDAQDSRYLKLLKQLQSLNESNMVSS